MLAHDHKPGHARNVPRLRQPTRWHGHPHRLRTRRGQQLDRALSASASAQRRLRAPPQAGGQPRPGTSAAIINCLLARPARVIAFTRRGKCSKEGKERAFFLVSAVRARPEPTRQADVSGTIGRIRTDVRSAGSCTLLLYKGPKP